KKPFVQDWLNDLEVKADLKEAIAPALIGVPEAIPEEVRARLLGKYAEYSGERMELGSGLARAVCNVVLAGMFAPLRACESFGRSHAAPDEL
ncbi:MAG: hypothetical protein GY844_01740, partial [Bradyrhizobium sp.]|nr:hypothetical protein [Bradyrhizobium sp.]